VRLLEAAGDQRARLGTALRDATRRLAAAGCDTPRLDAELLLGEVLGWTRSRLVLESARELTETERLRYGELIARRSAREPVAYLLGRRGFRRIEVAVDPRVLIPRPETELLVDVALSLPPGARVADVGTGSGAVALALADERPDLIVSGLDVSRGALAVARANAARLGLAVRFAYADLLDDGSYDAVVANLPYVATGDFASLAPEIIGYEPELALRGGDDGLAEIRRLIPRLAAVSFVALEDSFDQGERVAGLLGDAGFSSVERVRDLAGHERVVLGRR
jgi:release factor glutamine methyltransferase